MAVHPPRPAVFSADGSTRCFIEDNDTLTLRGKADGDGYMISFGECTGRVLPALTDPFAR